MAGRSPRSARRGAALLVCAAIFSACAPAEPPSLPIVRITVGEAPHQVLLGTTLGDEVARLILEASRRETPLRLGAVLVPGLTPGTILLNNKPAPGNTLLSNGDAILVQDGRDRTESTRQTVEILPGRHLGNPERTLRRYRIRQIRSPAGFG